MCSMFSIFVKLYAHRNCTFVNQLYQNAKKIHASQVAIDQSVFDSRIFDTENDVCTFGVLCIVMNRVLVIL